MLGRALFDMTAQEKKPDNLPREVVVELNKALQEGVRTDSVTRILYSTDASIYQINPLGVVFPTCQDELSAVIAIAANNKIPVLPRGAGSSLAGQAIGAALIIDTTKHLTRIIEIDPDQRTAQIEPGVILERLNRAAEIHGLMFGPDPASAERATMGGSIANNATGAHSILYGMAADHLIAAHVVLADGQRSIWEPLTITEARNKTNGKGCESALYSTALKIRDQEGGTIRAKWPKVWRRASGYSLNYLLPWSPSQPPMWREWQESPLPYPPIENDHINLAPLLAGSEGTLAVIESAKVRLVPKPAAKILVLKAYTGVKEACDGITHILESKPSAVELISGSMIELARTIPAYAREAAIIPGSPAALLVIEYYGETTPQLTEQISRIYPDQVTAVTPEQQRQVWAVRKAGLGLLNSRPGDEKPLAFIEDLSVPVMHLGYFVREMEKILEKYKVRFDVYAHASAGCLHIRPIINLKRVGGVDAMKAIAGQAVDLTLSLGGAVSGEHGDGLVRSQWLERAFGSEIVNLFRIVKHSADPNGILNPGKILNSQELSENLRYGDNYKPQPWLTELNFPTEGGMVGVIELCNGAGVCRKFNGVMCPSFQVTQEEMHSTRGRANLLRALISGKLSPTEFGEDAVHQALDLCLACKGCKAECPSSVDMAKLKYEFSYHYHQSHPRKLRDYFFGYIDTLAPVASALAPISNNLLQSRLVKLALEKYNGISANRQLPAFMHKKQTEGNTSLKRCYQFSPEVDILVLSDTYSRYLHPAVERAALLLLVRMGCKPFVLPHLGAGRALISKGFLTSARQNLNKLVADIKTYDPDGNLPIVGLEPSEIITLKDELTSLLNTTKYVAELQKRVWGIEEYLIRDSRFSTLCGNAGDKNTSNVLLHGHCYQKSSPLSSDGQPIGVAASRQMLAEAGFNVKVIDSGCCGMAGAFGYESEHFEISMKVGEQVLFPAIRSASPDWLVAAPGTSCRTQIFDGTNRTAEHPIVLAARSLGLDEDMLTTTDF